ncbi:hypothetical protein NPIL_365231 [Nephila pilipes]|uniref:Uncharacterized protein n=1 Tax=Nephila pilipes TaxID=299642 RepID=A0A8X6UPX5_NEPPI|nr:hypothetical protein NPIL_365231 [Nephila pilipes]
MQLMFELSTTQLRIGHKKIRGITHSGSQISVISKEFTHVVQYERDGHIEMVATSGKKEVAPLRIFEISIEDGGHREALMSNELSDLSSQCEILEIQITEKDAIVKSLNHKLKQAQLAISHQESVMNHLQ